MATSLNKNLKIAYRALRSYFDRRQPFSANLFVTKRCNLRCKMCNVWETKCAELDTARMKILIERIARPGVVYISFTGGEPFLRRDLGELAGFAAASGMLVQVNTNGTLPLSTYQKALDMPFSAFGVSLHSHQAEIHDQINASPGSWQKTVQTIKFLKTHGKSVYVCSVISPANITHTRELVQFCVSELDVSIGLTPVVMGTENDGYAFRGKNPELGARLEPSAVEKVIGKLPLRGIVRTRHFMRTAFKILAGDGPAWQCEGGHLFFAVMPDGQFGLCQDILTGLNVMDAAFSDKFHSREFDQFCRKATARCKNCVYPCYYDLHNVFCNPLEGLEMWLRNRSQPVRGV